MARARRRVSPTGTVVEPETNDGTYWIGRQPDQSEPAEDTEPRRKRK